MTGESHIEVRAQLEQSGSLHWYHWLVVGLSLIITLTAWNFTVTEHKRRVDELFERQTSQLVERVEERMEKYEEALLAGVSHLSVLSTETGQRTWPEFAGTLRIGERYPGINGIGIIEEVERNNLEPFLERQRSIRNDFEPYPEHSKPVLYPIVSIEPIEANRKALGLDMAHEKNRHTAALKAKSTRSVQITGPIVLVQDSSQTPGFLFFAPLFREGEPFRLVYAPFVMKKLLEGTLRREARLIAVKITDQGEVLYDEFDSSPLETKQMRTMKLPLYGRVWEFELKAEPSFLKATATSQPKTILYGGLLIDTLLVLPFLSISRANKRALSYADSMNEQLLEKNESLARINDELTHFTWAASHDLKEPIRTTKICLELLSLSPEFEENEDNASLLSECGQSMERMERLLGGLRELLLIQRDSNLEESVSVSDALEEALKNIAPMIEESEAKITGPKVVARVLANQAQLSRILQNLLSNAIKYRHPQRSPEVRISVREEGDEVRIDVADNGEGIPEEFQERIFQPFKRLKTRSEIPGTGLGLTLCSKVVESYGGRISVQSTPGEGSIFSFTLPSAPTN